MSILVCDIGNTSTKIGIYENNELIEFDNVEHGAFINTLLTKWKFSEASISSVVPSELLKLYELLKTQYGIVPNIITHKSGFRFSVEYKSPDTLGVDRLCGLEGAFSFYQCTNGLNKLRYNEALLTIDCGTATTINIVKPPNKFVGGVIAPGVRTMVKSLSSGTAQLPEVDLSKYSQIVGDDTESCITTGIINSTVGLIERVVNHILKEGLNPMIYITGGNAHLVIDHLPFKTDFRQDLVLFGIKSITEKISRKL